MKRKEVIQLMKDMFDAEVFELSDRVVFKIYTGQVLNPLTSEYLSSFMAKQAFFDIDDEYEPNKTCYDPDLIVWGECLLTESDIQEALKELGVEVTE